MATATRTLKPHVKEMWIAALESDEYKQAQGTLCDQQVDDEGNSDPAFCCLGVLCDLATKATKRHIPKQSWLHESMPPKEVLVWAGIIAKDEAETEDFNDVDEDAIWQTNARRGGYRGVSLAGLNDGTWMGDVFKPSSFKEIAAVIKRDF